MNFNIEKAKKLIEEKGFRRSWVAEKIGIKHSSLHQILNGRAALGKLKIEALGELLDNDKDSLKIAENS